MNTININNEDLPEDQRLKFEADLKWQNEEIKARMLACYRKTPQGVIEKEKFVMPSISSTTPPPPAPAIFNVSSSPQDLYSMLLSDLGKKIQDAQLSTQNTLIDLSERMDRMERGKSVNTAYSTKDLHPSSAAPRSAVNVEYGMPPNYFAGQSPPPGTVRPTTAEPVGPVASTGQTAASAVGAVRPVPWCWPRRPLPHSHQFQVRLPLAELMNWKALCRHTPLNRMASCLFHPPCLKMFWMI